MILGWDWPNLAGILQWTEDRPDLDPGERAPEDQDPPGDEDPREAPPDPAPQMEDPEGQALPTEGDGPNPDGALADFCRDQREDPTLGQAYEQLAAVDGVVINPQRTAQWPRFELKRDWLYHLERDPQTQESHTQLMVPQPHWRAVMKLPHDIAAARHLGADKTLARVLSQFYWPGVHRETRDYCASCLECQRVAPAGIPHAPLVLLPVVGNPFDRVAIDLLGPLERNVAGFQYLLIMMDYATHFPEAIPLKNATTCTVAGELVRCLLGSAYPKSY